jgi:hypothetical protein
MPSATEKSRTPGTTSVSEVSSLSQGDGTRQLLQSGGGTLGAGILAAVLAQFVFGGIGPHGPHTNTGWLLLIVAMMCLPFGFLLGLLGAAKWLRNRQLLRNRLNS